MGFGNAPAGVEHGAPHPFDTIDEPSSFAVVERSEWRGGELVGAVLETLLGLGTGGRERGVVVVDPAPLPQPCDRRVPFVVRPLPARAVAARSCSRPRRL